MTPPRKPADVPALALPVEQAAEALGLSQSHFREHVLPHVRSIKVGRVWIVPVLELERWLYLNGTFADEEKDQAFRTKQTAHLPSQPGQLRPMVS